MFNLDINDLNLHDDKILVLEDEPPPSPIIKVKKSNEEEPRFVFTGVVKRAGEKVSKFKEGDRVFFSGTVLNSAVLFKIQNTNYLLMSEGHVFGSMSAEKKLY